MKELYYKVSREEYSLTRNKTAVRRNILSTIKLLLFVSFVWNLYSVIDIYSLWKIFSLIVIAVSFTLLTKIDLKVFGKLKLYDSLIECCNIEIDCLSGNFSKLDKGERYISATHPYSHDLDIFGEESLFCLLNRTVTGKGTDRLATLLTQEIPDNPKVIIDRQKGVAELKAINKWMLLFRATGINNRVSESDIQYIDRWRNEPLFFNSKVYNYLLYASNLVMATLITASIINPSLVTVAGVWFVIQLCVSVFFGKKISLFSEKLGRFISSIGNYFHIIELVEKRNFTSDLLKELKEKLFEQKNSIKAFRSLKRIYGDIENRSNLLGFLIMNGLYIRDLYVMSAMDRWRKLYINDIERWIEAMSEMDMLVSLSTYAFNYPDYTVPEFVDNVVIEATSVGHPLIRRGMVSNDFKIETLHSFFIITGANMAGKSTFLRTIGVNMALAYTGAPVCAEQFKLTAIPLFTSMRTTDNLAKGTSYFHAELLRLRNLIDRASQRGPIFIILDEMLKGTNSHDKLNGSLKFLTKLLQLPVSGIIATHDLALGDLAASYPANFRNLCFEIEHTESGITYDYRLKEGISKNMNASILLEKMGLI
jgi:Mismatch repair ATPase (MutS family)